MSALLQLAERCEKAVGADFRLDEEILRACGWTYEEYDEIGEEPGYVWRGPDGKIPTIFPSPTTSLDAAMQLVPEGWHVGELCEQWLSGSWDAHLVTRPSESQHKAFESGLTIGLSSEEASAATPALALAAAALRARAAS